MVAFPCLAVLGHLAAQNVRFPGTVYISENVFIVLLTDIR